jgi:hypothetical protein
MSAGRHFYRVLDDTAVEEVDVTLGGHSADNGCDHRDLLVTGTDARDPGYARDVVSDELDTDLDGMAPEVVAHRHTAR